MDIQCKHLVKCFDRHVAVDDFSLHVRDHEFMVLVGPSGCGKSTLLRLIAGLEQPTRGELFIGGRLVNELPPRDRDVAMVFQSYALYPHMTVRENIAFGLQVRRLPQNEIHDRVEKAAALLGLSTLLQRKLKALSGGQRQRVALGRAIVRQPAVFLFDEPLSNLDAELRVLMRAELSRLQQRLNTTTVYVTHDQVEAMTLGHRIAVMNGGRLMQTGQPLEVYETPLTVFVARFIGTPPMNLFPMVVGDDGESIAHALFTLHAPERWRSATRALRGKGVTLGIRPEHLRIASSTVQGHVRLQGTVNMLEPLGHETIAYLVNGQSRFATRLSHQVPLQCGQELRLAFDYEQIHLFDAVTEQRLVVSDTSP